MRRQLVFIVLLVGLAGLVGIPGPDISVAPAGPVQAEGNKIISRQPLSLQPVDPYTFPLSANAAADTCDTASPLTIPGGDQSDVRFMSEDSSDPILSCAWGNPSRARGYRTVWYQFQPPYSGKATIETLLSNYDTILAVHTGSCEALVTQVCNDDFQGFTSRVTLNVSRDRTYYVEVADWQSGSNEPPILFLAAWIDPFEGRWQDEDSFPETVTRHATAVAGSQLYVLGGITGRVNDQELTNEMWRLNTTNQTWTQLASIPGPGYANGTAVYHNDRIYFPGGYNGNNNLFDDTHYVYNPATNIWSTASRLSNDVPGAEPLAYAKAVAPPRNAIPALPGYFLLGGTGDVPPFDPPYPTTSAVPSAATYYYLSEQNQWDSTLFPEMNAARFAHVAAWVSGKVCVAGGVGADSVLLTNGECYAPGGGVWRNTGPMRVPRYNAASAVGPDGHWYVYGGLDGEGKAVAITEVYNPGSNSWRALDAPYDLGGGPPGEEERFPRAWPQGGRIGERIWAVGGNTDGSLGNQALFLVDTLEIVIPDLLLPLIFYRYGGVPANDTFATAYALARNTPRVENFDGSTDLYDTYFFNLPNTQAVAVRLRDVPAGADYDLTLHNSNKLLLGESRNTGSQDEEIALTLTPGRYYLMVERVYPGSDPPDQPYTLLVRDQ